MHFEEHCDGKGTDRSPSRYALRGSRRTFLGFLGLKDLHFIYAEGLNMGEEQKSQALARARQHIAEVIG